jgi:cell division septal protein FtsQ
MAVKTRNQKQTTKPRPAASSGAKRRVTRRKGVRTSGSGNSRQVINFFVPLFFILCILFCLGFLAFMGYQTVTASAFFSIDAKAIDVRGTNRASRTEIERIVRSQTLDGVWNANLEAIRSDIEKLTYVKSVAVSRVLPNGMQVRVEERIPKAAARLNAGDFWVDDEAVVLSPVGKTEGQRPEFILRGWDESKTDRAVRDNQERIKLLQKMKKEWQELGIASRVGEVNISDLQNPQVTVEDSGASVVIYLGKEDFGKRLQKGLEVITGKGDKIESLISHGSNVVAKYRNS